MVHPEIAAKVDAAPLVDTHEHLIEESRRLRPPQADDGLYPCDDWAYLFLHYAQDDFASAGLSEADARRLYHPEVEPAEKWRILEPLWPKVRNTGYVQAARRTIADLYGESDLNAAACERVTERMRARVRKGFYREILRDLSGIECCQVNSLEHVFCETEYPDLLPQDLSIVPLSTDLHPSGKWIREQVRLPAETLEDWYRVIDWHFERYGPRAVAVKSQAAYGRRLDYLDVPAERAAPIFAAYARDPDSVSREDLKALQDHLFRRCLERATDYGLPVKLHTGYYAGTGYMPLERVRRNPADLCPLLQDFRRTRFVLMHIGYPYQDEMIALAKHYENATIDLCWAWLINPAASVRFLKELLMAAPSSKVLTFGGDYFSVETVYGHSRYARQGIAQALSELVEEGWVALEEALELVDRVMWRNAHELFPVRAGAEVGEGVVASSQ